MQRIQVETDPIGASVYLQRRGDVEVHGRVAGIVGGADIETFEEEFVFLGHTPVDYEFRRRETQAAVYAPEATANVTRHYREGTIRVEREGYRTVVRVVRFGGDPIVLVITLETVGGSAAP